MLRFNNGITSAGAALTDRLARRPSRFRGRAGVGSAARATCRRCAISSARRAPTLPFVHAPRVAFRCHEVVGAKWALLPSAAGVIDPLLSTGFPLTLLGIVATARSTREHCRRALSARRRSKTYAQTTQRELDVTEQLVGALYACMADPPLFKRLSLLYFAAASYSETVRRLGRPQLGARVPAQRASAIWRSSSGRVRRLRPLAPKGDHRSALVERIDRAIEPFDTAGLLDRIAA